MQRIKRIGLIGMTLVSAFAWSMIGRPAAALSTGDDFSFRPNGFCVNFPLPVNLADGQPYNQKIYGSYCQPHKWMNGSHEVDVLTEGATYNSAYWNWPQNPSLYSYVDKTLKGDGLHGGRAVVIYDRIATGRSTRPAVAADVTVATDAHVLHQIVSWLRLFGYNKINSVGHSYGSGVALQEAATYNDVTTVVATGYLHRPGNPIVSASNYPANQDPAFSPSLDSNYVTTKPNTRGQAFFGPSAEQSVITYDEAHKDIVSLPALLGFLSTRVVPAGSNFTNTIKVPVLEVVGEQDFIFCASPTVFDCTNTAAVKANEAPYYTGMPNPSVNFDLKTVPNTGHDLTLHPSANESFGIIDQWLRQH